MCKGKRINELKDKKDDKAVGKYEKCADRKTSWIYLYVVLENK